VRSLRSSSSRGWTRVHPTSGLYLIAAKKARVLAEFHIFFDRQGMPRAAQVGLPNLALVPTPRFFSKSRSLPAFWEQGPTAMTGLAMLTLHRDRRLVTVQRTVIAVW
jgi:hypothetical protein